MVFFALGSFSILLFNLILWILILYKRKKDIVVWSYMLWSAVVSGWSLGYGITLLGWFDKPTTLFWNRFCHANASFIGIFFLQLAYALTHQLDKKKKYMMFMYAIGISLLILDFTPLFIKDLWQMSFFKYQPLGGPLYIYFTAVFFYAVINGLWVLYRRMIQVGGNERQQLKIFLIGTIIGYTGGATLFLQAHHLSILPVGVFFIASYVLFTGYAIYKYGFMNIEVLVKKTLVFAGIFSFIFIFSSLSILVIQQLSQYLLNKVVHINTWASLGITIVFMILLYDKLKAFLINITNKYLFQKQYDPLQLLKTFSDMVLASVLDRTAIIKIATDLLMKALGVESFAILLMNKEGDKYEIVGASGIEDKNILFSNRSHLVIYLNKTFSPISKRDYDNTISSDLVQDMNAIKAELCIPLVFHKNLVGFLAFGRRKSDKDYTNEDIDILVPLTRDIAIALVYAQLYEEVRQKDKLATLGTLVAGIKHEIGNPLSSILTSAQLFMIEMEEWDSAGMSQKERQEKFKGMLDEILHEARRIGRITRKFTDFARPGDEGVKEVVDIKNSINEALEILENELSLKHIKIEKNIPEDIPKISADKDQMHQIFFNLLRNAAQAIEESNKPKENAKITIVIKKKTEERITIDISDTGCGISEEKRAKIFEPFYTTKERGKGTGLGLAIVRQLVGKNKGDISFKSQEGEGTTFTLEFPTVKK